MRTRWKITSGKETLARGSSPDSCAAFNLAVNYAFIVLDERKNLTIKLEKVEEQQ